MHFIHIKFFRTNAPTCFEPSHGSSSGTHTITNHTHYHNMVTRVGHNLKCNCYVDKMSLKLVFFKTMNKTWLRRCVVRRCMERFMEYTERYNSIQLTLYYMVTIYKKILINNYSRCKHIQSRSIYYDNMKCRQTVAKTISYIPAVLSVARCATLGGQTRTEFALYLKYKGVLLL
jgi:hypothetical protein